LRSGIELVGQRVGSKAEFHKGLGFRQARGWKSILDLKTLHGVARRVVPNTVRSRIEITALYKSLLDLRGTLRLKLEAG
jgi:hypothetical protein